MHSAVVSSSSYFELFFMKSNSIGMMLKRKLQAFISWMCCHTFICLQHRFTVTSCPYCEKFLWTKCIRSIWNETEIDCKFSVCWVKQEIKFLSTVSWSKQRSLHASTCNQRNSPVIFTVWSWHTRVRWKTSSQNNNKSVYGYFCYAVPLPHKYTSYS
jgi:hypothetical protein